MRDPRQLPASLLFWLVLGLSATAAAATIVDVPSELAPPSQAPAGRWLGPDGHWLPFTTDQEALDFLRTAQVVGSKRLSEGINKPLKVTLEKDGVRAHAIFRTVHVEKLRLHEARHRQFFRDSYIYEVAAYELSRLLGLDQVPPAVLRRLGDGDGSLQLWVEEAQSEAKRIRAHEPIFEPALWHQQQQIMLLFDNLIYNFDRNHGNMLTDSSGKLWFVDHTRSFNRVPALASPRDIILCERGVWERLRDLDAEEIRERLRPYLAPVEIGAVLKRRNQLLKHIEKLIQKRGQESVFFDLALPQTSTV